MIEVAVYHFLMGGRMAGLASMAGKLLDRQQTAWLLVDDKQSAKQLDNALWADSPESFLPHDIWTGQKDLLHPLLLICPLDSTDLDSINSQDEWLFFLNDNSTISSLLSIDKENSGRRIFLLEQQDGNHDTLLAKLHAFVMGKESDYQLTIWEQNNKGGWQKLQKS